MPIASRRCSIVSLLVVGTAVLLVARPSLAAAPLKGTQPAQWRIVWLDDPATTATILWSTAEAGKSNSVAYRVKGSDSELGSKIATSGRYTGASTPLFHHRVQLTDLKPATAYEIRLASDGKSSPALWFVTGPSKDRSFSLLHGGDSRSDAESRRAMNRLMATLFEESHANDGPADDILALAHGGDYIASGTNVEQWSEWMSDHELTTTRDGRLLPVIPARGNHDKGTPFQQVFGFPDDDTNYYGLNIGPQVRLVTLNSEISTAGDQAKWLAAELAKSRPANRWLLAQYHRPAFPAVKEPGTALQSWVPLFERFNVDLVCESDGHTIKRTVPIRNGKRDETGVVYVGEGGLGVKQRTPKTDRWYLQSPGIVGSAHHVFVLTFEPDLLTSRCVRLDGEADDVYTRRPRER